MTWKCEIKWMHRKQSGVDIPMRPQRELKEMKRTRKANEKEMETYRIYSLMASTYPIHNQYIHNQPLCIIISCWSLYITIPTFLLALNPLPHFQRGFHLPRKRWRTRFLRREYPLEKENHLNKTPSFWGSKAVNFLYYCWWKKSCTTWNG